MTSLASPVSSIRRGTVIMKLSSVTLTRTLVWCASVIAKAYARLSASFTRRPKGKWKMTFRLPFTSRYPSRRTWRSVGRVGMRATCSMVYETSDCAEPASTRYSSINHSLAAFSPSFPIFAARSRRNSPTSIDRSNDRGSISPVHEGTVGRRPEASFTYTDVPRAPTNWYLRPPHELVGLVHVPPFLKGHRDERLREDVQGIGGDVHPIDAAVVRGLREGRAFHEVPRLERDHPADRGVAVRVARPADPLQAFRDGLRRADLHDEVDVPDVDPEFEGRGGDRGFEQAVLQLLLDVEARDLRQGAVVGLKVLDASFLQLERHVLRPAPGVREDQGRAMLVNQVAEDIVHPGVRDLHGYRGHVPDGAEDREVERLARVDLDDVHVPDLPVRIAREELRLLFDRGNRRAQADPDEIPSGLFA